MSPNRAALFGALAIAVAAGCATPQERERETRLETEIVAAAAELGVELRPDAALRQAARELTEIRAAGADVDPHETLRQAESAHGVLDPFPYLLLGTASPAKLGTLRDDLLQALGNQPADERRLFTTIAVALVPERGRRPAPFAARRVHATFVLSQRAVSFTPLPDDARPGDRLLFEGEIHAPFHDPEIFVTWPDGQADELENLALEPGRFRGWIRLDRGAGEYQVEVLGRNDRGPRVLGLGSVFAREPGTPTPYATLLAAARRGDVRAAPDAQAAQHAADVALQTVDEAAAHLLELVNRDRRAAGLPDLDADPVLTRMARDHSQDMSDHHFFAHVSPQTGRLLERAEAAGLRFARLAENIAVHRNVEEAEAALLRSPGHRKNLLDPTFTRVGIGVVFAVDPRGERRVYVTQNFMRPAP